ncbi:hypothetical protein ONZ51_g5998 [Trametes cubensis]|uniref:Pre-mRNA-splicing factor 38 n=1 Tax=Trametes cubensis TaxID=1111947 RepID=A0AAD7XD35_9APHY|nr:hypothetical protein ONZ51_g5998 [Trametes cubensis]
MANTTVRGAVAIHGQNPQYLVESVIRNRIYESAYWKEHCFALTAETIIDKAIELKAIGGVYGNQKPTEFLCLLLKLLQIQPEKEILLEYLQADEFKYLRALAAMYIRMTFRPVDVYEVLEPLLKDYRKLRYRGMNGYSIIHMDEFVDSLLVDERVCDLILPRITKRDVLEDLGEIGPRKSRLLDAMEGKSEHGSDRSRSRSSDRRCISSEKNTNIHTEYDVLEAPGSPLAKGGHHVHPYNGARIINADSMQVYVGMDVITNKVPYGERCGVEHLLMDYKKPGEQLTGPEWIADAIKVIDETHARNQVPIVVGGTSYWIQHLIFPERMASLEKAGQDSADSDDQRPPSESLRNALAALPPEMLNLFDNLPEQAPIADEDPAMCHKLHDLLMSLDQLVAQRWHWRDSRKVLTSLRTIQENRRLASEVIAEQSQTIPTPRYRTLCFWLYAKPDILKPRLDERVNQMIEQGLLNEIRTLRAIASEGTATSTNGILSPTPNAEKRMDYTLGIYQAIGYKEFHDYLSSPSPSDAAFREAVEQMKLGTRRYAKRQVTWIRNKLLPAVNAANAASQAETGSPVVPTYLLDATELGDAWKNNVHGVAERITHEFLEGKALPDPKTLSPTAAEMLTVRERPTEYVYLTRSS